MILKNTLKKIVQLQRKELDLNKTGVERDLLEDIDLKVPHAIILSGIRRCGKSTLLKQLIKKVNGHYYFNFEDQRLLGFEVSDFEKLNEVLEEEYGKNKYYFFDEIQNVPSWERFIRRLLDSGKRCIITGSNASLLSRELGTRLTGRHLRYELFPFSYNEMLKLSSKKKSVSSFEDFSQNGGFPEYLIYKKIGMLQELLKDILSRDIIVRHGLRRAEIVRELAIYLLTNVGKELSYNNLSKYFNLGSPNTIISYISYFEDSYLFFTIPKFDYSFKKQVVNPKKIYSIDVGLARANSASFSTDLGRVLENVVFLNLRSKYKDIFYFKEKRECDFVIKERNSISQAIQVCYELNEENKDREINGLKEAMEKFKLKKGLILTLNQKDISGNIEVKPVWEWMGSC